MFYLRKYYEQVEKKFKELLLEVEEERTNDNNVSSWKRSPETKMECPLLFSSGEAAEAAATTTTNNTTPTTTNQQKRKAKVCDGCTSFQKKPKLY